MARKCRRDLLVLVPAALGIGALSGGTGCSGKDPFRPGDPIGAFHVTATLTSSTCGQTPNPWQFDIKLRYEHTTLFWVQGDAPIAGQVDPSAHATLTSSDVQTIRAAGATSKMAACAMSRNDELDLALGGLSLPVTEIGGATSFEGTLSYRFAATEGSDCEDQLAESGGDFTALPCDVAYAIRGTRTGDSR